MEPTKVQAKIDAFNKDLKQSVEAANKARTELTTLQTRIAQLEGAIYALTELQQPEPKQD
jgi:BMFP domain-containing protein YqiC